mgnify:FL=1
MIDEVVHIFLHSFIDSLKILPFLFIAFLIIEIIEHKLSEKSKKIIENSGKFGPVVGAFLGLIPQCGFSVVATNLYVTRILSLGTLISIYLATSDEMLPIMISNNIDITIILQILLIKLFIGIFFGVLIDFFFRNKRISADYTICDDEHCHCEEGVLVSSLKHTVHIFVFIFLVNFVITLIMETLESSIISSIFMRDSIFAPFVISLLGLIPNCASSVIITELFLNNAISFGSLIAGLLANSGMALLVLFKSNKNLKENFMVLGLLYFISVISGIIIMILS